MSQTYNIYCDESCHLERDRQTAMVLAAIWCPLDKAREIAVRVREIKAHHGMRPGFEVKWTKVSPAKKQFYLDLMDYFFDDDDLHFRALIVPDKGKLQHKAFSQSHDEWYYKMYFDLLKVILSPEDRYRVYLDLKDTQGARKVARLHDVLANNLYDFSRLIIERVQLVRSHEVDGRSREPDVSRQPGAVPVPARNIRETLCVLAHDAGRQGGGRKNGGRGAMPASRMDFLGDSKRGVRPASPRLPAGAWEGAVMGLVVV